MSLLPALAKNYLLTDMLLLGDIGNAAGYPGDVGALHVFGIAFTIISAITVALSRLFLGEWPKTVLIILGAFLAVELVQDITMGIVMSNR